MLMTRYNGRQQSMPGTLLISCVEQENKKVQTDQWNQPSSLHRIGGTDMIGWLRSD
jgi:hypothetical protein